VAVYAVCIIFEQLWHIFGKVYQMEQLGCAFKPFKSDKQLFWKYQFSIDSLFPYIRDAADFDLCFFIRAHISEDGDDRLIPSLLLITFISFDRIIEFVCSLINRTSGIIRLLFISNLLI
jgi:hypothetical protein